MLCININKGGLTTAFIFIFYNLNRAAGAAWVDT
jgi:hypothetical protein